MRRNKVNFLGVIAGVLAVIFITLIVCACIPQTQAKMADLVAEYSPKYQELLKQNESNSMQLLNCKREVISLSNDKLVLIETMTELDNNINETSDPVEINNLIERKNAILEKVTDLDSQINELNNQIALLNDQINSLNIEIETIQAELDSALSKNDKLKEQYNTMKQSRDDYRTQVRTLQTENADLTNQISSLQSRITMLETQIGLSVVIEVGNGIESIVIEDTIRSTKFDIKATVYNGSYVFLTLFSGQKITIKYASVNNCTVKAIVDGTETASDTVEITYTNDKKEGVRISSKVLFSASNFNGTYQGKCSDNDITAVFENNSLTLSCADLTFSDTYSLTELGFTEQGFGQFTNESGNTIVIALTELSDGGFYLILSQGSITEIGFDNHSTALKKI